MEQNVNESSGSRRTSFVPPASLALTQEPTPTQLASLPPASPLIERVYYTAGCWWAPYGPAPVLPVLASKPSPQAQGLASGTGSHGRDRPWSTTAQFEVNSTLFHCVKAFLNPRSCPRSKEATSSKLFGCAAHGHKQAPAKEQQAASARAHRSATRSEQRAH